MLTLTSKFKWELMMNLKWFCFYNEWCCSIRPVLWSTETVRRQSLKSSYFWGFGKPCLLKVWKLQMVSLRWCKENMWGSRIFVDDVCWSCQAVSNSLYYYILSWIQYDSASPTLNPILNTPSKLGQYSSQVKHCVTHRNEPHQHLPFWMLRCKLKLLVFVCKLWHSISKNDTIYYMQVILSICVFSLNCSWR